MWFSREEEGGCERVEKGRVGRGEKYLGLLP